jgi:hypothetical protein
VALGPAYGPGDHRGRHATTRAITDAGGTHEGAWPTPDTDASHSTDSTAAASHASQRIRVNGFMVGSSFGCRSIRAGHGTISRMKLTIIANGQHTEVAANQKLALHSVIPSALEQAGYEGWAPDNWEVRDVAGTLLDTTKRIAAFKFGEGARLYLNLRAGVGG